MKGCNDKSMLGASLRDINKDDLVIVLGWRNQEHIRNVMFKDSLISWDQHVTWYKTLNKVNKLSKIFAIKDIEYGVLNIYDVNQDSNSCSWGFYVGDTEAPKGTGLLLGYTSLEFIFKKMKIRKLCAEVIETNKISCKFHEKLGFKLDGTLRKHIKRNDTYEDVYVYSLFAEEWEEKCEEIKVGLEERFK